MTSNIIYSILFACAAALPLQAAKPVVIAHRGASGYVVEHTLPAKAVAHAMGADFLEQDVALSKDGVLVVSHDITLDDGSDVAVRFPDRKRENGRFYIADFTLAELRQLRLHERTKNGRQVFAGRFPGGDGLFQINTFEEELEFIQGLNKSTGRDAGVYVEIKSPKWHREQGMDVAAAAIKVLKKFGYSKKTDNCWIQCFEWDEVRRIRSELGWEGRLLLLTSKNKRYTKLLDENDLPEVARVADGIGPELNQIVAGSTVGGGKDTGLTARAHALGLAVHPYTIRKDELPVWAGSVDEVHAKLFGEAKIDGCFTDFPDLTVQWVNRHAR
ncbi:MAG: glycerophosphodiester phosphodiesterase [Opitutaceae bacterium]|jgi:glycerophosphoryl diester phosphodiesterase|nr:glycerophosphodiester phosphodiesterase [Opitutaceae bacterium]